eukprot:4160956-Amphidinium_carterae.1
MTTAPINCHAIDQCVLQKVTGCAHSLDCSTHHICNNCCASRAPSTITYGVPQMGCFKALCGHRNAEMSFPRIAWHPHRKCWRLTADL